MLRENAVQLIEVLDHEKDALFSGDFSRLATLASDKKALEDALLAGSFSADQLKEIERKTAENERLFGSAIRGVKAAQTRLHDMTEVRTGLSLYTKDGAKMRIARGGKSLQKKA